MSIQALNISYSIHSKTILKNITLECFSNEIHSILGKNGAGKSTLLKILSGSLSPSSGEVFINSKNILSYNVLELSKIRSYLSQEVLISVPITVQELVELGRTPYFKMNISKRDQKISQACIRLVGNFSLKSRNIFEVSGGEKQRSHIARVIAQIMNKKNFFNKYLFLDESFSNLDIQHQLQIFQILRSLVNRGLGVILTLHDLNLAASFSDRVTILKSGTLLASGYKDEVLTEDILQEAYEYPMKVFYDKDLQRTCILPKITKQGVKNGRSKQIF